MINCGATGQCDDLYLPISFEVRTMGEGGAIASEDMYEATFGKPAPLFTKEPEPEPDPGPEPDFEP